MRLADWRRSASISLINVAEDATIALIEADVLLCHVLSQSRSWLYAHADDPLDASTVSQLDTLRHRRLAGEPMAYITGDCEFRSHRHRVTPAVLIPRDDTEVLVEATLEEISRRLATDNHCHVLDAGTGSGVVAISVYMEALAEALAEALTEALAGALTERLATS